MSVKDIKDNIFTYNNTIHDTYILSVKMFLNFMGSKFGPNESNLFQHGKVIVCGEKKPCHLESKTVFKKVELFRTRKLENLEEIL